MPAHAFRRPADCGREIGRLLKDRWMEVPLCDTPGCGVHTEHADTVCCLPTTLDVGVPVHTTRNGISMCMAHCLWVVIV